MFSPDYLRADTPTVRPDLPRPLVLVVPVGATAAPGDRKIALTIEIAGKRTTRALTLSVLPRHRPEPSQRVGAFLDFAPHLSTDTNAARRQAKCDMDTLR